MYGSGIWLIQPIAPAFLLKDLLPVSPWLFVHHYSHPLGCPLKPILLFIMLCSPQGSWGTLPFWAEAVFLAPPDCEATQGSATKSLFCHGCWLCHAGLRALLQQGLTLSVKSHTHNIVVHLNDVSKIPLLQEFGPSFLRLGLGACVECLGPKIMDNLGDVTP